MRKPLFMLLALLLLLLLAAPAVAGPALSPPWDGSPISKGIGPTYGETWPVPCPTNEAIYNVQGAPHDTSTLSVMPYADVGPLLAQYQDEGAAAGLPQRMTWEVSGQSAGGRDLYLVVVNALETANQRRDFARWQHIREIELTNPAAAQVLLDTYGEDVKMPIYIEANINGTEYEGTDAMMQVIRDLVTTPRGENAVVDKILDHAILVVVPTSNPDGRVMGIRGNSAVADTNRDYFLQSQPEEKINAAIQQEWLPTGALHLHGYVSPMLVDGDTMPLNAGLDGVKYYTWNTKRATVAKDAFAAAGYNMQIPVLDWNESGNIPRAYDITSATQSGTTVTVTTSASNSSQIAVGYTVVIAGVTENGYNGTFTVTGKPSATTFQYEAAASGLAPSSGGTATSPAGPSYAQTWDGWGPFYGQTYSQFLGVDSSTCEMANTVAEGGRLTSKKEQYLNFYATADFWLDNRQDMMGDQISMYLDGVTNAPTNPNAFADSEYLTGLGFTDAANNWMATYPKAYVIPWGAGQRSDAEANRLAQWCLDNGIQVQRMSTDFTWGDKTFEAGSYVVSMNQALRGLAWDCLAPGVDIESRISDLYASPAAWSHGLLWGADTVEIPRDDAAFAPETDLIMGVNSLAGGVRGGIDAPADFYSVTPRGVTEEKAILALLKDGVDGYLAEEPFTSTTGGDTPAGSLIFPADAETAAVLDAAGQESGLWFERNVDVAMPATTVVADAPKIAILVNSVPTSGADTDGCLGRIFGTAYEKYVATTGTASSLQGSSSNPLNGFNVIYNAGGAWPSNSATIAPATVPATITASGATEAGSTVTITTSGNLPGTLKVGSSVTVAGVGVAGYNGTWTVTGVLSTTRFTYTCDTTGLANSGGGTVTSADIVAGATESGDTVTITLNNAYYGSIKVGSSVTVAGVGVAGYNGTYTVTAVPSPTQFQYTNPTTGLAVSGGGTVTSDDVNAVAKSRLAKFFSDGGGYIATSTSTTGFSFLSGASLINGTLAQNSTSGQSAFGGIAVWDNIGGADSPVTGPYPSTDTMFLPSTITYFATLPTDNVVVDAKYTPTFATVGPANGFVAGMWLDRDPATNSAPVLVRGTTKADSRYMAYSTNPFSRYDAEREWPLVVQSAMWSDLTDEGQIAFAIEATAGDHGSISPNGSRLVAVGADQAYAITPDAGYHVADVVVDGTSVGAVTSYDFKNVADAHTIAATFAIDTFTVTASAGAHGSITPAGTLTLEYGADQVFTITPDEGYQVTDVLVDGQSVGAVTTYTLKDVAADHTVSASFALAPTPWKVTLKLSKPSVKAGAKVKFSGSVKADDNVAATGKVTIQKRKAGGSWVNWKTARLGDGGKYSLTVKMTKKGTFYFRTLRAGNAEHTATSSARVQLKVR